MGGCCCCFASDLTERNRSPPFFHHPVSEEQEPLSSHHEISTFPTGLLVDTNLDTSVPDTYRPPPAPIPYETYLGGATPSGNQGGSGNKGEVRSTVINIVAVEGINDGSTLETKVKKQCDENSEKDIDLEASKLMEDEKSDELKKGSELLVPPLQDEDDCAICLEEYDEENPKILTNCDHHFHLACILEWMERSDICPLCDQEMVLSPATGV